MLWGTAILCSMYRPRKLPCFSSVRGSSLHLSPRTVSSTGHAEDSMPGEKLRCANNNDRVGRVFCECFKGMEKFLVRRPGCPPQQPMKSPLFTTAAGVVSSSTSSSTSGGESVRSSKTVRSFFPGTNDLFYDANAPGLHRKTLSSISGNSEPKHVGKDLHGNSSNDVRQQEVRSPLMLQATTSFGGQQTSSDKFAAEKTTAYADIQRYSYAYSLWQNRNAALLQMGADMQEMTSKACYLRDLHQEDLKDGMRQTTRFSIYVVFPFVFLVSAVLFNESTLYSAQLKYLRLVDYDAWLEANGQNSGRRGGIVGGGGGGGGGGFSRYEQRR
ncbi:hypothetical protein MOQ_003306 [Trypanosoma cruzi marinkellei]|uniref:Transmembrane protein n=1 Tax=Trypanosoma cruzi marinkellei TaxID=85056 RepID=K2MCA4_TRYCR|nr:hypothetical protein MOQ_003306 [Trypanosoma cruzi marinkellei]